MHERKHDVFLEVFSSPFSSRDLLYFSAMTLYRVMWSIACLMSTVKILHISVVHKSSDEFIVHKLCAALLVVVACSNKLY